MAAADRDAAGGNVGDADVGAALEQLEVDAVTAAAEVLFREQRGKLLSLAQGDESAEVRARAWESLIDATEEAEVVAAMLQALHNAALPVEERGGLVVGLAPLVVR